MADQEKETRSRKSSSAKAEQQDAENTEAADRKAEAEKRKAAKAERDAEAKEKREAEKKEREEKRAAEKAEREQKKAEEKEQKERERAEAKEAKERVKAEKLQEQIDSGDLIFADFDRNKVDADETTNGDWSGFTYTVAEPKKEDVAQRALAVIQDLQEKATEVPLPGKELADEYLGGTVQWVAFFGMLRVIGWVKAYRFKTGERGGQSGLAYLWIGPDTDFGSPEDVEEVLEEASA